MRGRAFPQGGDVSVDGSAVVLRTESRRSVTSVVLGGLLLGLNT